MKTWLTYILAALFAVVAGGADAPPPEPESYELEISLLTPYNRDFTMLTTIRVGQPFEMVATNGRVRNTVSGTLQPPKDGKYPIDLMVSEWESEKSNIGGTTKLALELGKAWSGGPVSSFVYLRHVTLRKHVSRIIPK